MPSARLRSATILTTLASCRAFAPRPPESISPKHRHPLAAAAPVAAARSEPRWVPWEIVELASDDMNISHSDFVRRYADAEACTSCDDDGDDLHECDFFGQYLGPTRWLRLTPEARAEVDEAHFRVWEDVWSTPRRSVDAAEEVSRECFRYYNEFMLEPRSSSSTVVCPTDRPLVRVKVVPASFGLEAFEDAVWEATEDLADRSCATSRGQCEAVTFVAAAPDPLAEEAGLEKGDGDDEFAPERFREFARGLRGKLAAYSEAEGVPLDDAIGLTPFHPGWSPRKEAKGGDGAEGESNGVQACNPFPYPCVAVSTKVEAVSI